MKFFTRSRAHQSNTVYTDLKSYRFFGEEAEALGNRLDAARRSLASAKTKWAQNYWTQTVERLLFQWQQLPILHDGDAMVTIIPRWHVDYEFFEKSEEAVYGGFFDRLYHIHHSSSPNLNGAWENNRARRLARAQ
jgi:hypothetical protein